MDARDRNLVIIAANPYSGSSANPARVDALTQALRARNLESRVIWAPAEHVALTGDAAARERCRCVVAAGGDGTVCRVINERLPAPLAVLPLGTENLFAREFGFALDPERLADRIARAATRRMDLGRIGGHLFALMFGVGMDAEIARRLGRWRAEGPALRRVSYLSYIGPILGAVRRYRYPRIELECDGERVQGAQAFVFNAPRYALRLPLAPDARTDDGCLDWLVLQREGARNLLRYAWRFTCGRRRRLPDVRHGRGRRIAVTAVPAAPVQVDGDPWGETPVVAEVLPGALEVVA